MNVLNYIAHETERQSGTVREGLGMYRAWESATRSWDNFTKVCPVTEPMLKSWAGAINNLSGYRRIPVTFRNGGHTANHENIPRLMRHLIDGINFDLDEDRTSPQDVKDHFASFWVKEFLVIHPFSDGNGRVASLLWNYIRGTIFDPEPMPYFFGET